MKKILFLSLFLVVGSMFVGCGSKSPYVEQKPVEGAALVYVYVVPQEGVTDNNKEHAYKIRVNGKNVEGYVKVGEYVALNLKPGNIEISAIRADVEVQSIKLQLSVGDINYLKVKSYSDSFAKFDIIKMQNAVAKKEITTSVDAKSKNIIEKEIEDTAIFADKKESAKEQNAPVQQNISSNKTDELEKAYKLKEKGVITEEEFKTLKSQIISK